MRWFGRPGMHWPQLKPTIQLKMLFHTTPALIVVHLGGNDLVSIKLAKLMSKIKKTLWYLQSVFNDTYIVWSDILPRTQWRGLDDIASMKHLDLQQKLKLMDQKRKRVNRAGRQAVRTLTWGRSILHEIDTDTPGLLKRDGTHLSKIGNHIFLLTLQEAIRLFLLDPTKTIYDSHAPAN